MDRDKRPVLVTGGASFIGSHFVEGLHRTIDWYFSTKDRSQVSSILEHMLTER